MLNTGWHLVGEPVMGKRAGRKGLRARFPGGIEKGGGPMKSIRIVKRTRNQSVEEPKSRGNEKTRQQNTREMVSTVKAWVAEWEQRQRAVERATAALLR